MTKVVYALLLAVSFLTACSSSQKLSSTVVETPFSGPEYLSDNTMYRYVQSATHANKTMAEKKAEINAKTGLASLISSHVSAVTESYITSTAINGNETLSDSFREVVNTTIKQDLRKVNIIGKEEVREANGDYTVYVAVEVAKESIKEQVIDKLSENPEFKASTYEKLF